MQFPLLPPIVKIRLLNPVSTPVINGSELEKVALPAASVPSITALPESANVVPLIAAAELPPITAPSIVPELISMPVTAVVPSRRLSILSRLVLILVPQVSSDAPTSGLTKLYVVVVVSAILISYAA